jgi:hypothetical protein
MTFQNSGQSISPDEDEEVLDDPAVFYSDVIFEGVNLDGYDDGLPVGAVEVE